MKVLGSKEMRSVDRRTIEEMRVPGRVLMENAGRRVAEALIGTGWTGLPGPTLFLDPRGRPYGTFQARSAPPTGAVTRDDLAFRQGWAFAPLYLDANTTPTQRLGDAPWWGLGLLLFLIGILRTPRRHDGPVTVGTYDEDRTEDAKAKSFDSPEAV